MSNTPQTEAMRLADFAKQLSDEGPMIHTLSWPQLSGACQMFSDELRRLDAIEQRHTEMMANPCPEWDGKAYMQAIAGLRAQLDQAVAEERERCAQTCDRLFRNSHRTTSADCAVAIRALDS